MKLAVMQPYLFSYPGYFHLIHCADQFVVLDDVQYIKRGWINRNKILIDGREHLFTLSLKRGALSLLINEKEFSAGYALEKKKFMHTLMLNYAKAPYFVPTCALIEQILDNKENNVSKFIVNSLRILCQHIGIKTELLPSSQTYQYSTSRVGITRG